MYPKIYLRPDKIGNVAFRHPWIFSGALGRQNPDLKHGSIVQILDPNDKILGTGTYSAKSTIAVRVFAFGDAVIDQTWIDSRIREADQRRRLLGYGPGTDTTGYRVVFGEADSIPGLVVDRYTDVLVFQISTAGLDNFRDAIVESLINIFEPRAVVERSDIGVRSEEALSEESGVRFGDCPQTVEFSEYGAWFCADILHGQKTGFYLDQKDLRREITSLAQGRSVLDLFSYTGAASVSALKGGADAVLNVDSSEPALSLCTRQLELNGLEGSRSGNVCADAFQWLGERNEPAYDMILMDPPALIKSQGDVDSGRKAYHFLNRAALRLANDGAIFVTSSCSNYLPEEDLIYILRRASVQAGVDLRILKAVRQAPDHPQSVYFPEGAYLKSLICQVRR
jgi:23S rRNA (cytosine1962-C5)-methyltransferase